VKLPFVLKIVTVPCAGFDNLAAVRPMPLSLASTPGLPGEGTVKTLPFETV